MRWMIALLALAQDEPPKHDLKLNLKAGLAWTFEQSNSIAWHFEKIDENSRKMFEDEYKARFSKFSLDDKRIMDFQVRRAGEGKVETLEKELALQLLKISKVQIKGRYFGNDLDHAFDKPEQKPPEGVEEGIRELLNDQKRYLGSELRVRTDARGRFNGKEHHFVFGTLPENPVPVGEKWDHASSSVLDPLGIEVEIQAQSTLVSVENGMAAIQTSFKVALKGKSGGDPKFEVDGSGSGKAELDVKNGRLVSASSSYEIKVKVTGTEPETKKPVDMQMVYTITQGERNAYGE